MYRKCSLFSLVLVIMVLFLIVPCHVFAEDTTSPHSCAGKWHGKYKGLGIGYSFMGMSMSPDDLNDWLESEGYETLESAGLGQTTLYWSFSPSFHLGLTSYRGGTDWQYRRVSSLMDTEHDIIYGTRANFTGVGIIAEYKKRFGGHFMFHAGGGFGAFNIELDLEKTELNSNTVLTRYRGTAGGLQLNTGMLYYLSPFVGIDLELGLLAMSTDEMKLGGVVEEEFPEVQLGGGYIGLGLKVHI